VGGVRALNERHGKGREDRFFLFHRARRFNPGEAVWMGWERKRGKLEEFMRLLRGATDTSFEVQIGDVSIPKDVRSALTLSPPPPGTPAGPGTAPAPSSGRSRPPSTGRATTRSASASPRATGSSSRG